jgi:urea transport system substrate-binding protein
MEAAYVGVKLWAAAVQSEGSLEPLKIRAAMLQQRIQAPEGEIRFDPSNGHAYKTPRIGRITIDGGFEIVSSDVQPEAPQPFPRSRSRQAWLDFQSKLQEEWNGDWAAPSH